MIFFGREVTPSVPYRKIFGTLNKPTIMKTDTSLAIFASLRHVPSASLLHDSAIKIAREFWWTNQELSPVPISFRRHSPYSYITRGMNSRLIYGRSSDPGRPNDMTNS
jgi:hypothetical protein